MCCYEFYHLLLKATSTGEFIFYWDMDYAYLPWLVRMGNGSACNQHRRSKLRTFSICLMKLVRSICFSAALLGLELPVWIFGSTRGCTAPNHSGRQCEIPVNGGPLILCCGVWLLAKQLDVVEWGVTWKVTNLSSCDGLRNGGASQRGQLRGQYCQWAY